MQAIDSTLSDASNANNLPTLSEPHAFVKVSSAKRLLILILFCKRDLNICNSVTFRSCLCYGLLPKRGSKPIKSTLSSFQPHVGVLLSEVSLSVCPSLMLLLQGGAPIHVQGDRCIPSGQIALKWADDSQLLHEVIECH